MIDVLRGRRGGAWSDRALALLAAASLAFLFLPIVTAVLYAFNEGIDGRQTVEFTGFTTKAFGDVFRHEQVMSALSTGMRVAILGCLIGTVLGTLAGLAMARARSRTLRIALTVLVGAILVVPEVVVAVAILLFFTESGVQLGLGTMVAGLTPYPIAVVALIVRSRAVALDGALEEAAADLGAPPGTAFRDVVVPQLRPAIIAAAILSFTFTFDNLVTASMLSTPTVSTLSSYLYATVTKGGVTPLAYAVAALMFAFTLVLLAVAGLLYRWDSRRQGNSGSIVKLTGGDG